MQLLGRASGGCLQRSKFSVSPRSALLPSSVSRHSRRQVLANGKKTTGNATIDNALEVGGNLVESAASLVPDSVPRGVAKGGVAVAGVLVAFWVLQKLVSTVLTVALLGGAAWFYFQYGGSSGSSDDSSKRSSGSSGSKDVDLNDPLAEARRIMDKYKK